MQSQYTPNPPPAPAPSNPTPTLLPGPFILFILLPTIPLLLFSLGARPPNTSSLPFSTNELFVTTTMICLATGAVLLLGVYPDVGGQIWGWIRDGDFNLYSPELGGPPAQGTGFLGAIMEELGLKGIGGQMGLWTSAGSGAIRHEGRPPAMRWVWDGRYRRWVQAPAPVLSQAARGAPVTARTMAHNHLTTLRTAHSRWYSPHRPSLILALLLMSIVIFLFIVLWGNFLRSAYDTESSSSSSSGGGSSEGSSGGLSKWVDRELRKRKAEKDPADTIKRVKQETVREAATEKKKGPERYAEWKKTREKEKAQLKKELTKRKMPLADLEKDGKDERKADDAEKKKKETEGGEPKESTGSKIKKALLRERAEKPSKPDGTWEPADPNVAEVTVANSTANAQNMAEKFKAGR
ncbi:hypothetical protein IAR50_001903 [Cryptococcus sp. DSM 104548]